jgi:hypothetical protein
LEQWIAVHDLRRNIVENRSVNPAILDLTPNI